MRRAMAFSLLLMAGNAVAEWQYEEFVDPFTDEAAFILTSTSKVEINDVVGNPATPFLQLRCDKEQGQPYWRIHWHNPLPPTPDGSSDLQLRFDDGRVYSGPISLVAGWPQGGVVEAEQSVYSYALNAVLKRVLDAERLRARITAFDGRTLDADFDVSGLEEALEKLKPHCKRL